MDSFEGGTSEADPFNKRYANLGRPSTPAAAEDLLDKTATKCNDMSAEISQLPSTYVDSETVAFGANNVQTLHECALVFHDMLNLLKQDNLLKSYAQSASVLVESFVRGALGNPLGTTKDIRAVSQKLTAQGEQLQARLATVQQQMAALDAREVKLRAMLSEKYHREFPPLSPPRKSAK